MKYGVQSARDLAANLIRLAMLLDDHARLERVTLVAFFPKMTSHRVRDEWVRGLGLLRPDLATRFGLVALTSDGDFCDPDDAELAQLTVLAREALHEQGPSSAVPRTAGPWSPKQFDVWMVLLEAYLLRRGPLPIKDVLLRSGTSTATVAVTFDRLRSRGEITRTSSRRASFADFPRRSLEEILSLSDGLRHTMRFIDESGRAPDPHGLLQLLEAKAPSNVGLGGVEAARCYAPKIDLEGLSRIDISVHGQESLEWLETVAPSLRPARNEERSPILVVHRIVRPDSGFKLMTSESHRLRIAGPAETLLDLHELRLTAQADKFVQLLREDPRRE